MKEIGNRYRGPKGRWVETKVCPKCKQEYSGHPALSREDNKTKICSKCGQIEALEAFQGYLKIKHEKGEK